MEALSQLPKKIPAALAQPAVSMSRWMRVLAEVVVVAAAVAAYHNSLSGPFILDDLKSIAENPTIRHFGSAFSPPNNLGVGGRPVINLSFALNYALGGPNVWGYHAFNLLIHMLAGLTLLGILRRTLQSPALNSRFGASALSLSLAVAVIWIVHPLQTEAVTYITQRCESLMGLFYLLTLYSFIRSAESNMPGGWRTLSVLACLLGVLCKEIIVSAPVMILLYDRTFVAGSFLQAWRLRWRYYLGLACTWLVLVPVLASSSQRAAGFDVGVTSWTYALTSLRSVVLYLRLAIWPHPLVFDYGQLFIRHASDVILPAIILAVLVSGTIVALWRWPAVGFVGAWFFGILAPASSVVPLVGQPMAEHRMYLPLVSMIVLIVIGIHRWLGRGALLFCLVLIAALSGVTWQRNEVYHSALNLWSDTVAKRPDNPRAHNNLGSALDKIPGRLNEAIAQYQEALRLNPNYVEAHYNLGRALAMLDRTPEAIAQYEEALRLNPGYVNAHYNLGLTLEKMPGRMNEAIAQYEETLRLKPDFAEAHFALGSDLQAMPGRLNDAIVQYREGLLLKPDYADAHYNLACALQADPSRLGEAATQYEEALRLKPDFPDAHYNLGCILQMNPGRLDEAIAQYKEALRLRPDFPEAHDSLGSALVAKPDRMNEAIAEFEEALRLKPDFAEAHSNLGNALSSLGQTPEAIVEYQEALRLKPDDALAHFNLAIALLKTPDRDNDAIAQLRETLRLQPENDIARQILAKIHESQP